MGFDRAGIYSENKPVSFSGVAPLVSRVIDGLSALLDPTGIDSTAVAPQPTHKVSVTYATPLSRVQN